MASLDELVDLPGADQASVKALANQFVTFTSGDRDFGVDIMSVREIRGWSPVTELPSQPYGAIGVLDIRGKIVQVYDLQRILGGHADGSSNNRVVLVVSLKSQDVGLLVDTVSDIVFAQTEDLRPLPGKGNSTDDGLVSFMVKIDQRLIAMLNLPAIFPGEMEAADAAGDGAWH